MDSSKICVISYGVGGWYSRGQFRLERSLLYHGFAGEIISHTTHPYGPMHSENPYAFKIYAFEEALQKGFTHILWLDSSVYAIADIMPLFDYINDNNIFAFRTGYNCAQSCNDRILQHCGITRDEAENVVEYATGCVGLNFDNPDARNLFARWSSYMHAGMFKGSRQHDNQSSDSRFMFHRQDQSAFSLSLHQQDIGLPSAQNFISYYPNKVDDNQLLFIKGL